MSDNGLKTRLNIQIDQDRMAEMVTVDQMIGMQSGDIAAIADVLSMFVLANNGQYLRPKDARPLIGKMTIRQMTDTAAQLNDSMETAAATPKSEETA